MTEIRPIAPPFMKLSTRCESLASHPGHFTARETTSGTHLIRDWVGPSAGLDTLYVEKILLPFPGIEALCLRCPVFNLVTILIAQSRYPLKNGSYYTYAPRVSTLKIAVLFT
jgi:hypothetical protein